MKTLSNEILNKIKVENIKPVPKWEFILKDGFIWFLFIVNTILGIIGFAMISYLMGNSEIFADFSLADGLVEWVLLSVPVIWILITCIFIFVSFYNFKHTPDGYKYFTVKFFISSLIVIMVLGTLLNKYGISERLNNIFSSSVPYYNQIVDMRSQVWMRPDQGYLAGTIVEVNNTFIKISDLDGNMWTIFMTDAFVSGNVGLNNGIQIKIQGEKINETEFKADSIRPWNGMGMNRGGRGMMFSE